MADRRQTPTAVPGDGLVPLDSILCTAELRRRPARAPDYEREARAMVALAQALADSPRTVLQKLAEMILDVLRADTAGISLLTTDATRFYWPAIAGTWQPHIGGGTPRDFGPCGDVLDRDAPQLFTHIERRYTYFLPVSPVVEECLLVPFYVDGRAVGTIWAVAHDDRRKFDAEDMRLLVSLGTFAASAYQTAAFLDATDQRSEVLRQSQDDLAHRVTTLQTANVEVQASRRAALNLMEDAVQARQALEALNLKLHDSEQRFARFMRHLPGLAWIKDSQGRYVYANDAAEQAFHARRSELYGKTDQEVFPPETAAQFTQNDRRALHNESSIQTIETLRHADGIVHHSIVNKFAIPGPDDEVAMVGGVAIDITELRQAEEALRASEERLRLSQQVAQVGTFDLNLETGVNIWTPELERMYGLSPGTFAGTQATWESLVYPEDLAGAQRQVNLALQTGAPGEAEWRVRWPDGTLRWLSARFQAFMDPSGKPVRLTGVNLDITERKQHEKTLSESDRHKTEFLAMLAHELRNPLAPILVSIEILHRAKELAAVDGSQQEHAAATDDDSTAPSGDLNRRVDHALDVLRRQVGQMVRLVDDLLDAGRISRGKIDLRKERVELSSVLCHAVEAVRPIADSRTQELTVALPADPMYLNADPTRLAQIVGNLLNNACKFTDRGGHIWLTVERTGDSEGDHAKRVTDRSARQIAIRVRDTGIGIAADQIEHIFDMFAQGDTSLERSLTGLGIGLTLVKTLTEMHGGTVDVRSAGVGQGSEFVVRLPLELETRAPDPLATAVEPAATAPLRILIVDDNRDSADMLALLLKFMGHETHTAHDGVAAVEEAARIDPDVILLDIGLPRLNGYDAARRIREQHGKRGPLLVALTGWGQDEDRRRSEEAGFDAHVVKPVDHAVLTRLLSEVSAGTKGVRD